MICFTVKVRLYLDWQGLCHLHIVSSGTPSRKATHTLNLVQVLLMSIQLQCQSATLKHHASCSLASMHIHWCVSKCVVVKLQPVSHSDTICWALLKLNQNQRNTITKFKIHKRELTYVTKLTRSKLKSIPFVEDS